MSDLRQRYAGTAMAGLGSSPDRERAVDVVACKKCGGAEFYSDGRCKDCVRILGKKYRLENRGKVQARHSKYRKENLEKVTLQIKRWNDRNPDKVKAQHVNYYANNKEKVLARTSKYISENKDRYKEWGLRWRAKNPEKCRELGREWRECNPGAERLRKQNRRSRENGNGGVLSKGLAEKLFKLQKGLCVCCGKPLGKNYHLDHKMPLALGGENEDWNMQLLRARCNGQKAARHPIDFMQSRGFLI